jgi:uncharacterized 2Fe-2S/4Fe-4S cluster protein (DUF4445 family)
VTDIEVIFEPDGRRSTAHSNQTILDVAHQVGLQIRSDCGGQGICGKCRVHVEPQTGLKELTSIELSKLTSHHQKAGFRLACQARINGTSDLIVTIPTASRGLQRQLQITGVSLSYKLNPAVHTLLLTVPAIDPSQSIPDTERLLTALSSLMDTKSLTRWDYPLSVIEKTPNALRKASGEVTLVLRNQSQILDIHAGDARENIYGIAFDIGTSKLVGSLFSLTSGKHIATEGMENPQLRFGEDIMTRLSYAAISGYARKKLQSEVIVAINSLLSSLTSSRIPLDQIYELVIVGNTVMTSLFLGLDTKHLAYGPFTPPFRGPIETQASKLGLDLPSQTIVYVLPNVAGYVGADALANILATGMNQHQKPNLLIDIGTNSEVILGNHERIAATSCAAGPAFEGAQIEHGMKAVSGAIEQVTLDPQSMTFQLTTIDNLKPIGICGSGVIDAIAQLAEAGLLSKKGRFTQKAKPYLISSNKKRVIILYKGERDKNQPSITLSEHDISQLLLAKAAIQSGYTLLLQHHQLSVEDLNQVFIAGAFGNYLNLASAKRIGLIPPVSLEKVSFIGNAALSGAQLALLSTIHRRQATQLAHTIEFVDLARHPAFSKIYATSLFI